MVWANHTGMSGVPLWLSLRVPRTKKPALPLVSVSVDWRVQVVSERRIAVEEREARTVGIDIAISRCTLELFFFLPWGADAMIGSCG